MLKPAWMVFRVTGSQIQVVAMVIPDNITQLLLDWSDGDQVALDKLMPFVEAELRRLAHNYMRRERRDHTLQTTAVVNEAYIRLVNQKRVRWQNRAHFFAIAASFMRRILVDYAKSHKREKRGGDAIQISLTDAAMLSTKEAHALLELDLALDKLANLDERKARVTFATSCSHQGVRLYTLESMGFC